MSACIEGLPLGFKGEIVQFDFINDNRSVLVRFVTWDMDGKGGSQAIYKYARMLLSARQSVCLTARLSVCLSDCVSVCLSV